MSALLYVVIILATFELCLKKLPTTIALELSLICEYSKAVCLYTSISLLQQKNIREEFLIEI